MKPKTAIVAVCAAVLLSACIPSVNPFYTEKDVVFEERLLGEWEAEEENADGPEIWRFEKSDLKSEKSSNKAYKLAVIEKKDARKGEFMACLFRLKKEYFLDIIPADCEYAPDQADLVEFSMFPGHLLVRVSQIEPQLKLAFFDFDLLEKHLKANPKALAHHREGDRVVLTASARDLQRFVLKHLADGELFEKPGRLTRKTNSVPVSARP
jgi:hypothetical protein